MSERPLREQIKREVQRHHLDDEQYAELERMMAQKEPSGEGQGAGMSRRRLLTGTAVAAALAGLAVGGLPRLMEGPVDVETLAEEVLRNHRRLKPLDLETRGFEQLSDYFSGGLDFRLVHSERLAWDSLILEGGRYCSLAGARAAQLLMRTPEDALVSFYQTRYDPDRFGALPELRHRAAPVSLKREEYRVELWVERGILMAAALPHSMKSLMSG